MLRKSLDPDSGGFWIRIQFFGRIRFEWIEIRTETLPGTVDPNPNWSVTIFLPDLNPKKKFSDSEIWTGIKTCLVHNTAPWLTTAVLLRFDGSNAGDPEEPADRGHWAGAAQSQGQDQRGEYGQLSYIPILSARYSSPGDHEVKTFVLVFCR